MNKKKKIILIVVAIIVILVMVGILIYEVGFSKKAENNVSDGKESKVSVLYSELNSKQVYGFTTTLDEQNIVYYAKKDNMAYIKTTYQGKESKFIIKDGNSYLIVDDQKTYYTYQNNEVDLEKIVLQLEKAKNTEYVKGKETIENKQYEYEEYDENMEFLVNSVEQAEEQAAKTRFYFDGNKLVYIKTIIGDYEELLKVEISDNVDDSLFEIPSDYQEM